MLLPWNRNNKPKFNVFHFISFVSLLSKYASVNISTNLYVISQPWLFSLAWCAGAHSVTTNAPHLLKILHKPIFLMVRDAALMNTRLGFKKCIGQLHPIFFHTTHTSFRSKAVETLRPESSIRPKCKVQPKV